MLGANIKFLRIYSDFSQAAFGKIFGLTRGMVETYERGAAKPSLNTIEKIAQYYKLSIEDVRKVDLKLNPGLLYGGGTTSESSKSDLIKMKDAHIKDLQSRVVFLEEQVLILTKALAKK